MLIGLKRTQLTHLSISELWLKYKVSINLIIYLMEGLLLLDSYRSLLPHHISYVLFV